MIFFQCDYAEGGHPKILERMMSSNMDQEPGYGNDSYCERAKKRIRTTCGKENADIHFFVGGTQANLTVISSILRPYQGVLTADEGHIASHETGAIEATGHKVLPLSSNDAKITGKQIRDYYHEHVTCEIHEHIVQPGMVYISFPTESGSLYSKKQLTELSEACHECGIPLYIDGARLGYGLMSPSNDLTIKDIADLCDIFYIGGTKCGGLFGEAVIIVNDNLKKDFRYCMKQRGGLLAKGRLLGLQFDVLFEDNLYFDICKKAVDYALMIRKAFEEKGVHMYGNSQTNQQFPILTNKQIDVFKGKYAYEVWGKYDNTNTIVRFCTSWATTEDNVMSLLNSIKEL